MLDRFDLIIEVPEVSGDLLFTNKTAEASDKIAARVIAARSFAAENGLDGRFFAAAENADELLHNRDEIAEPAVELLKSAIAKRHLTARGFFRVLKVARTIANLAATRQIQRDHIAEALAYRMMLLLA